ncbi:DUF2637 domain-containing protein [Streptomyces sp. NPDC047315]|uniref:DUF2637 domain-containing protein n=1 Tax=Streptomyces sp. NPDC047315 TaxID=3155142 RepID=UPI0033EF510B
MTHRIRVDAVLVQAVIAGALSFAHLHDLAEAAGQSGWKAWLYPISVDLLLVAAWRRLRSGHGGRASGWSWFLIALAASLGANIATAGLLDLDSPPAWLRVLVAGWPAIAFLGGTLLVHTPPTDAPEPAPAPAPAAVSEPPVEQEPGPAPAVVEESLVLPAPAAEPAALPAPEPAPVAAPMVPVALVEHARKLDQAHHDATGAHLDADALRARLGGIPAPMASAIHAQLT